MKLPAPSLLLTIAALTGAMPLLTSCKDKEDREEKALREAAENAGQKPVPPDIAEKDFNDMRAEEFFFLAKFSKCTNDYYGARMQLMLEDVEKKKPGASEEMVNQYAAKSDADERALKAEDKTLDAELNKRYDAWKAKNWSGYIVLPRPKTPPEDIADTFFWSLTATAPQESLLIARTDFQAARGALNCQALAVVRKKLRAAWLRYEEMKAPLPWPPPKGELEKIQAEAAQLRAGVDEAIADAQKVCDESKKMWAEWESKNWVGYAPASQNAPEILPR